MGASQSIVANPHAKQGRCVHHVYALIQTATQITQLRPNTKEALAASSFLENISTEHVLQLGMLADAAHEAMVITRFVDKEDCRTEDIAWELEAFTAKVTMLFTDRGCVNHGFTAWALKQLKVPMLIYHQGTPKLIGRNGGVRPEMITRCMDRMACWVKLCGEVIQAEFPVLFAAVRFLCLQHSRGSNTVPLVSGHACA